MSGSPSVEITVDSDRFLRADFVYALGLFVAAVVTLAIVIPRAGGPLPHHDWGIALLFLGYGLFTITVGYPHPHFGYLSFDRVSQVASILVLGPVDAAWINGLASLIYPWHRLWRGIAFREVVVAALNNSGLMALMILLAGSLYTSLGGVVPLMTLTGQGLVLLHVLTAAMQLLNDLSMLVLLHLSRGDPRKFFNLFAVGSELSAAAIGVLVALVHNRLEPGIFVLLIAVLSIGMLVHRQFANMRYKLEAIVEERTRSLKEKTLELERQATQDKLTGLFNRRYADSYLERELENAKRYGRAFTIALGDIDLFKQINDRHSHATGDEVLRRVAAIFNARCRKTDMIARYGGEEFLFCFPQTDCSRARQICEELRHAIETEDWSDLGLEAGVTISFGLATVQNDSSRRTLLMAADLHLYHAKNSGRNLVIA